VWYLLPTTLRFFISKWAAAGFLTAAYAAYAVVEDRGDGV
jgi:hypothetical protein